MNKISIEVVSPLSVGLSSTGAPLSTQVLGGGRGGRQRRGRAAPRPRLTQRVAARRARRRLAVAGEWLGRVRVALVTVGRAAVGAAAVTRGDGLNGRPVIWAERGRG